VTSMLAHSFFDALRAQLHRLFAAWQETRDDWPIALEKD
jgi:hypothetical protein